jgi:hypothetical protein
MRHTTLRVSCSLLLQAPAAGADKLVPVAGGDITLATKAELSTPFGADFLGDRILIVEMAGGERLRTIDDKGRLVTIAGKEGEKGAGGAGRSGDEVLFNGLRGIAAGPTANERGTVIHRGAERCGTSITSASGGREPPRRYQPD